MRRWLLAVVLFSTTACPPPGEGVKAERGYKRAGPIIAALERFHADSGHYPSALSALVPAFLADSALAVPTREQERYPWRYTMSGDDYTLQFQYTGPGMNACVYRRSAARWQCSGVY